MQRALVIFLREFWRYQEGNKTPKIVEQTWPTGKGQEDKYPQSTSQESKDWATPNPLFEYPIRISS